MYNIGDKVLYGGEGVCRISGIEDKRIAGQVISYYVLCRVDGVNSVFFVPVKSRAAEEKMRKVISAGEIKKIVSEAKPVKLCDTERERKELYKSAVCSADRPLLASLIKSVCAEKEALERLGKKLHKTEEYFLSDAQKMLYSELSSVMNINKDDVLPFVLGKVDPEEK